MPNPAAGTRAGVSRRLGALLLDGFVVVAVFAVLLTPIASSVVSEAAGLSYLTAFFVGLLLYTLIAIGFFACGLTPGKYLAGIRVVDKRNGNAAGFGRMFIRETLGKYVSSLFFSLGYFWAIWDRDSQTWHDKIANTMVLKEEESSAGRLLLALICFVTIIVGIAVALRVAAQPSEQPVQRAVIIDNRPTPPPPLVQPESAPEATSTPTSLASTTEDEISHELDTWAEAFATNNLEGEIRPYADTIDRYFLRRDVGKAFVLADKQESLDAGKRFTAYSFSTPVIEEDGPDRAIVTVRKTWQMDDNGISKAGQGRSRYWFSRAVDGWRITGEQDLLSDSTQTN